MTITPGAIKTTKAKQARAAAITTTTITTPTSLIGMPLFTIASMTAMTMYPIIVLQLPRHHLPALTILLFLKPVKITITINTMKGFEIAKGFLKIMTNHLVDKTMVAAVEEQ